MDLPEKPDEPQEPQGEQEQPPQEPPQAEPEQLAEALPERLEELLLQLEAAIFAAGGPGLTARLRRVLDLSPGQIDALVERINTALSEQGRPYEIVSVAGGYQFRTRMEWSELIGQLQPERKQRLSAAALDTLAVIAYKQPITRAEIEELRGVDCDGVLRSLMERRLTRVVGRRDAAGRPALFGTTPYFLEAFGLRALHELPALSALAAQAVAEGSPGSAEDSPALALLEAPPAEGEQTAMEAGTDAVAEAPSEDEPLPPAPLAPETEGGSGPPPAPPEF